MQCYAQQITLRKGKAVTRKPIKDMETPAFWGEPGAHMLEDLVVRAFELDIGQITDCQDPTQYDIPWKISIRAVALKRPSNYLWPLIKIKFVLRACKKVVF